jgi:hypothetical protein
MQSVFGRNGRKRQVKQSVAWLSLLLSVLFGGLLLAGQLPSWAQKATKPIYVTMCPEDKKKATYKFSAQTDSASLTRGKETGTDGKPLLKSSFNAETGRLILESGVNDGDGPLRANLDINITYTELKLGGSRRQAGQGLKTTNKHVQPVIVTVKPQFSCKRTYDKKPRPKTQDLVDSPAGKPTVGKDYATMPTKFLCKDEYALVGPPGAGPFSDFIKENVKADTPVLRILREPDAQVATAKWFNHQATKLPGLLIHGVEEGKTSVLVGPGGSVMASLQEIVVRPCTQPTPGEKEARRNILDQGTLVKPAIGRVALPSSDELVSEPASLPSQPVRTLSDQTAGLNTTLIELPEGTMALHCPSDTRPGDSITCSVQTDGADLTDYRVEMESVAVFVDDEEPVDTAVPANATGIPFRIIGTQGETVAAAEIALVSTTEFADEDEQPEGVVFPQQMFTNSPVQLKGNFKDPAEEISVNVGGEPANVIVRSPRGIVVANPSMEEGEQEVLVSVGGQTFKSVIPQVVNPLAVAGLWDTLRQVAKGANQAGNQAVAGNTPSPKGKKLRTGEAGGPVPVNPPPLSDFNDIVEADPSEVLDDVDMAGVSGEDAREVEGSSNAAGAANQARKAARQKRLVEDHYKRFEALKRAGLFPGLGADSQEVLDVLLGGSSLSESDKKLISDHFSKPTKVMTTPQPSTQADVKDAINKLDLTPEAKDKLGEYILPKDGEEKKAAQPDTAGSGKGKTLNNRTTKALTVPEGEEKAEAQEPQASGQKPSPFLDQPQTEQVAAINPLQDSMRQLCAMTIDMYRQNLRSTVDEGWKSPKPPQKGTYIAKLQYDLQKDGYVRNIRVLQSSGYKPIDDSAINRVQQLQGTFRPIPSCFSEEFMEIDHTFKVIYR